MGQAIPQSEKSESTLLCEVPTSIKDTCDETNNMIKKWTKSSESLLGSIHTKCLGTLDTELETIEKIDDVIKIKNKINKYQEFFNGYFSPIKKDPKVDSYWIFSNIPYSYHRIKEVSDLKANFLDAFEQLCTDIDKSIELINEEITEYQIDFWTIIFSPFRNHCYASTMVEKLEALKDKLELKQSNLIALFNHPGDKNKILNIKNAILRLLDNVEYLEDNYENDPILLMDSPEESYSPEENIISTDTLIVLSEPSEVEAEGETEEKSFSWNTIINSINLQRKIIKDNGGDWII